MCDDKGGGIVRAPGLEHLFTDRKTFFQIQMSCIGAAGAHRAVKAYQVKVQGADRFPCLGAEDTGVISVKDRLAMVVCHRIEQAVFSGIVHGF